MGTTETGTNFFVPLNGFVAIFSENGQNDGRLCKQQSRVRAMVKVKMLNIVKDSHC